MADYFYGLTDTGKQRQNNEDAFIAQPGADGKYVIACVIDGVGGYSGGEIAAALARESVLQRLAKPSGQIIPLIIDAFNIANQKIWEEKQTVKQHNNMACVATLAVVDLETNQFYYAHVGDTRLYLLRDGSLVKITHDQSFVGFLEESGRLSEKEAMNHPKRNEIDKALGFKNTGDKSGEFIETGQSPFLPGDMLLLCSDGLTDLVDKASIKDIVSTGDSLKTKCTQLIDAANHNGGKDNITVVLVENNKASRKREATKPAEIMQAASGPTPPHQLKQETIIPHVMAAATPARSNKWLTLFFLVIIAGLLTICAWQYLHYQNNNKQPQAALVVPVIKRPPNAQEIKLQNAINNAKGKGLILYDTAYHSPVTISRPIIIKKDTLVIKAKGGIIFQSDSGYHGAAFNLSASAKLIVLDSLNFKQFNVGITGYNNALELRNTRFTACKIPVRNIYYFPDGRYVNGSFANAFFITDSLPKTK